MDDFPSWNNFSEYRTVFQKLPHFPASIIQKGSFGVKEDMQKLYEKGDVLSANLKEDIIDNPFFYGLRKFAAMIKSMLVKM